MSCTTRAPYRQDLPSVFEGTTLHGIGYSEEGHETDLASVRLVVTLQGEGTPALTLDNGAGITIDSASGTWEYQVDTILSVSLAPGIYSYVLETTDSAGVVRIYVVGGWQIKSRD